jgi:1A family penicillin-binding protein
VARASRIKPDVKTASKLAKNSLSLTGKVLIHIGRPFYLLLSYSALAFLFIAYWIGRSTRLFLTKLAKLIFAFPEIKLPKLRIPKLKIPELKPIFGIFKLKIRLFILRKIKLPPLPKISLPKFEPKLVCLLLFISLLLFTFWLTILKGLPSPKELVTRDVEVSTKIYDRNGVLLYKIYKDQNRTIVPLDQIPLHVRLATLAIEDAEFYVHPGFSVRGILRATLRNLKRGELTGGSTITQQLVKNALLSSEKTIVRKIKEIILAVGVELVFTKDEILEMYLNEVSYGGTAYGIQEAAQLYFDKDVDKLTLAEAALLAGLPKSPTKFSPFGSNPELGLARQKEVLKLMRVNKYITKEHVKAAEKEELTFAPNEIDIKAPHFVMYVRQALVEKYGEEVVEKGGLEVMTTLDYSIQKMAEEVVKQEVEKLSRLRVGNGAALVIDSATGEILAMVGSKDYFDTESDGNVNVTTRLRQPGSSIKIINYAYALSNGYTPASILSDTPITFSVAGQPPYTPRNYDGAYRGKISLRSALAESRNIPAVKVLASYGVSQMLEMGQKMGITTWDDISRFGLSLTLGGGDVKLIDLAKAYATLANYGRRPEFISVLKVTNYRDKILEENECVKTGGLFSLAQAAEAAKPKCEGQQVLDPRVAFLLIDILNDSSARAPAFGTYSQLVIPGHDEVVVKTGTSNDLRDNLTVGFSQKYLVAVWVGNNDNSSMSRVASGVTGATPIWNKIMRALLANEENHNWEIPEGLVRIPICSLTGTLPCEGCPTRLEWFLEENQPQKACNLEQIEREKKEREEREKKEKPRGRILEPAARTQR